MRVSGPENREFLHIWTSVCGKCKQRPADLLEISSDRHLRLTPDDAVALCRVRSSYTHSSAGGGWDRSPAPHTASSPFEAGTVSRFRSRLSPHGLVPTRGGCGD